MLCMSAEAALTFVISQVICTRRLQRCNMLPKVRFCPSPTLLCVQAFTYAYGTPAYMYILILRLWQGFVIFSFLIFFLVFAFSARSIFRQSPSDLICLLQVFVDVDVILGLLLVLVVIFVVLVSSSCSSSRSSGVFFSFSFFWVLLLVVIYDDNRMGGVFDLRHHQHVILVIMFFRVFLYLHILFLGPPGWLSDVHTTVCVANMCLWAQ